MWSEYKKCNIIKYLISMTPDKLINFISESFCGRISDAAIVEMSQYLNLLPNNCAVMADRRFKNIDHLIQKKGYILIRLSNVLSNSKPMKKKVIRIRRMARASILEKYRIQKIKKI